MPTQKHKDQRVAVFIDAQNMYHSARHLYNDSRVNFKEILKTAVDGRRLVRAFSYVISTKTGEERGFFDAMSKLGIENRAKDLQEFFGGAKKADWDVGIAIDVVRTLDLIDVVVLVSGDGDFIPLIEYVRNRGRRAEVISFGRSTSGKLKEAVDEFIDLDDASSKYLLKKTGGRSRTQTKTQTSAQSSTSSAEEPRTKPKTTKIHK